MSVIKVLIEGRVQGVGFRAWLAGEAESLGLSGWTRNLKDGRVEAVFAGEEAVVERMLEACRQGPRLALVRNLSVLPYDAEIKPGFSILPGG